MDKIKEMNWGPTLMISILFGYLGIDRFIFKKTKSGFLKLGAFILSITTLFFFENILRLILSITTSVTNGSKNILSSLGFGNFILLHIPKIIGLATLTLFVMIFLLCTVLILIWWIEDIIMILKKEEIEGIDWK